MMIAEDFHDDEELQRRLEDVLGDLRPCCLVTHEELEAFKLELIEYVRMQNRILLDTVDARRRRE